MKKINAFTRNRTRVPKKFKQQYFHGFQIGILKRGLLNLMNILLEPNPDLLIGLSTFESSDTGSTYLHEMVAPTRSKNDVIQVINELNFHPNVSEVLIFFPNFINIQSFKG